MKKIDLHIHTIPTISDSAFTFSLETFKRYVEHARLDAVAVTNHDVFDAAQFKLIQKSLDAVVFPGIEINLEKGHLLIIADGAHVEDFAARAKAVSKKVVNIGDCITVEELKLIFGDLSNYLVIPHTDKAPPIGADILDKLRPYVSTGEVDSPKKFVRATKDETKLTPVLFSDARMREGQMMFSPRQTFIDCGELTLSALKSCLQDKTKVALSQADGNRLWQVFDNGLKLSTGLNVLIGARSSGKTHTLDAIKESNDNAKYIEQFSLVQRSEDASEREFTSSVEKKRSMFVENYLTDFRRVVDAIVDVDTAGNEKSVRRYIETLLKSAAELDRRDAFSKATLFDEADFSFSETATLMSLVEAVRHVIENIEFRDVIQKHLDSNSLKCLACELIDLLRSRTLQNDKKRFVNGMIKDVKQGLRIRTSAVPVEDVDLYEVCMDAKRVEKFDEIVGVLKQESVVHNEVIQGFRVEARRQPYSGASELRSVSGLKTAFSDAYRKYSSPYEYLRTLMANEDVPRADIHRLFVKISYRILNQDGFEVSGGERSEFRLLQEIADAQSYEMLLVDEPESSFDNLFLKSDVNQILKAISETMPVVVVTHNSTVGASIGADYVLHTRKEFENGKPTYRIYSGYPTDKMLLSVDGRQISTHEVLMDSLEAGVHEYERRRRGYEAAKG